MKNAGRKIAVSLSALTLIVSFQNCGKLQPGIVIDDQLLKSGLESDAVPTFNSDEIPAGESAIVDIGEVGETPAMPESQMPGTPSMPVEPVMDAIPPVVTAPPVVTEPPVVMAPPVVVAPPTTSPTPAPTMGDKKDPGKSCNKDNKHNDSKDVVYEDDVTDEEYEYDRKVCYSQMRTNHKMVFLNSSNSSYDGSKDHGNKTGKVYIYAAEGAQLGEIKNTHGKVVLCGCKVKRIANNNGSLVMVNSYSHELDGKKGNLKLINSTISKIANMKGVIKK